MTEAMKANWLDTLMEKFDNYVRKYDLPEDMAHELSVFVETVAREQYKAGNKSGIAWLRRQMSGGTQAVPAAA